MLFQVLTRGLLDFLSFCVSSDRVMEFAGLGWHQTQYMRLFHIHASLPIGVDRIGCFLCGEFKSAQRTARLLHRQNRYCHAFKI